MGAESESVKPFDKRCADALADEVAVLVRRKVIDSRSPAADALLDYRDPPSTPRADRLAAAEARADAAERELTKLREAGRVLVAANTKHFDAAREAQSKLADAEATLAALREEVERKDKALRDIETKAMIQRNSLIRDAARAALSPPQADATAPPGGAK